VEFNGPTERAVDLASGAKEGGEIMSLRSEDKAAFFRCVRVLNHAGHRSGSIDARNGFSIEFTYEVPKPLRNLELSFRILTRDARPVFTSMISETLPAILDQAQQGERTATAETRQFRLSWELYNRGIT
jgi:hypothetical protein